MIVKLWGVRGSLACSGSDTARYGGNTSCVEISSGDILLVLDAGTGIRRLGENINTNIRRVDILLTHLHLDHILGLGFFKPIFDPNMEVHLYGPSSAGISLNTRLSRYLSPPLFPVHFGEVPCKLYLHEVPGDFELGPFHIYSEFVCHPGRTVGYRIQSPGATIAYIPDHEPALGVKNFPLSGDWTSGYEIALEADLLIHDAQYTHAEYQQHIGWGHSAIEHALDFAKLAKVKRFLPFHHDPSHTDEVIDSILVNASAKLNGSSGLILRDGYEGQVYKFPT